MESKYLLHKSLGIVKVSPECLRLQAQNPDPTSIFVEHGGEIKEVSKSAIAGVEMADLPTFDEINQHQKPAGTYDLYASMRGLNPDNFPLNRTLTVTLCQWEIKPKSTKTRVHRYHSKLKIRFDRTQWYCSGRILMATVKVLNSDITEAQKSVILGALSTEYWSKLAQFAEIKEEIASQRLIQGVES